jgi:bile acid:Na+ symporter, BASS family
MRDIDSIVLNFSPGSLTLLNVILGIVIFSIAIDLRLDDFRALSRAPKSLFVGLFSQFVVLPFVTFLMILAVQPRPSIALGLILVAACPGGNISNFITHRAGGNTALSVSMTAIATVLALMMTPANVALWGNLYGPTREILHAVAVDPMTVITVLAMLILPLFAGVTLNTRRPDIAVRMRRPMQWLAMVIFLLFIVLALAANWDFFLDYAPTVSSLVILHNTLALVAGYVTARLAGVSEYDRRAIVIETGIQNSGLGLILIFAFFNGLGGMAVVAALWGIWHAVSGMALASVMARKEAAA